MLPVKKISKTRTRTRRAHHFLTPAHVQPCPMCGHARKPHTACDNCGYVSSKVQLKRKAEEA